jgi:predicted peptidase
VYLPPGYDPALAWPLVVFLHGRGESGTDGVRPCLNGLGPAILRHGGAWPAIAVFPQKPTRSSEWEQHEAAVMGILAAVRAGYRVDDDRIYLTGMSQGGHGTWVLGARHRETWAALASVCGYATAPTRAARLAGLPPAYGGGVAELAAGIGALPLWIFHGDRDDVVPPGCASEMVEALAARGHPPRFTVYPGVGHDSWDRAYAEGELPAWLLSQHRPPRPESARAGS